MTLEEVGKLSLVDMKRVAKELNISGYQNVSTKEKMMDRINAKIEELGMIEVPDLEEEEKTIDVVDEKKYKRTRIDTHPKVTCIIETRDEDEIDLAIGINEYQCYIQFGKEITIPEPVFNMVKGLTTIKFEKDENGFSKSKEIKKYIVNKV